MRRALLTAMFLLACKSDEAKRLEKLAEHVNPVIAKLRPSVEVVLQSSEPKAVRTACLQAIAASAPIQGLVFDDRRGNDERMSIDAVLKSFEMRESDVRCKPDEGDGERDADCMRYCKEMFRGLADALDDFHRAAAKEHVEIRSLK